MMKKKTFKFAFKTSLPIMAGYLFLGTAYGVSLQSKGYGWILALFSSIVIYAGSMQFVQVELLRSGANILIAAIMTILVNLRMMFYGIPMLDKYNKAGKKKPYLIFALTDETFAVVSTLKIPDDIDNTHFYLYFSLLNHIYWIVGSVLGVVLGDFIPFNLTGIDFSMTCLFVIMFIEQWLNTDYHKPHIIGVGMSLVARVIFGPDNFLIPAIILMLTAILFIKDDYEKYERGILNE